MCLVNLLSSRLGCRAGSMRMLMNGQLVALSEEDRRQMREGAAAAKRAEQEAALGALRHCEGTSRARRLHRATADVQPGLPTRGFPSGLARSGQKTAASLGMPRAVQQELPTQQSWSRCAPAMPDMVLSPLRRTALLPWVRYLGRW